jgi:hypothetical protein
MVFKSIKTGFLTLMLGLTLSGCGDQNAYDGQSGLLSSASSQSTLDESIASIYENVIYKDINDTYNKSLSLLALIEDLNASVSEENLIDAQDAFKELVLLYKRVETVYVAGYNDDTMRETAEFYLEHYIKGSKSQDIKGDLDLVFAGTKSMVANSLKGITALEYTLFGDRESSDALVLKMNQNRLDAALLMINKISGHLNEVKVYYEDSSGFASSGEDSLNALLNVLVQQAFNLREWRIGEAAGLTLKYEDDPDAKRLEYYYSQYSLESMKAILNTHKSVIQSGLEDIAEAGSASSELNAIKEAVDDALDICESYTSLIDNELASQKTENLFETARTIQNNYTALITGLNFKQDILEADGD